MYLSFIISDFVSDEVFILCKLKLFSLSMGSSRSYVHCHIPHLTTPFSSPVNSWPDNTMNTHTHYYKVNCLILSHNVNLSAVHILFNCHGRRKHSGVGMQHRDLEQFVESENLDVSFFCSTQLSQLQSKTGVAIAFDL